LPSIEGHTSDVSSTGIGLIVPAIRIGEHYLVGDDKRLHLSLDLPSGPAELTLTPVRYESLEEHEEEIGYLIGARILDMNEADRKRFEEYLATVLSKLGGGD